MDRRGAVSAVAGEHDRTWQDGEEAVHAHRERVRKVRSDASKGFGGERSQGVQEPLQMYVHTILS